MLIKQDHRERRPISMTTSMRNEVERLSVTCIDSAGSGMCIASFWCGQLSLVLGATASRDFRGRTQRVLPSRPAHNENRTSRSFLESDDNGNNEDARTVPLESVWVVFRGILA